ncbi:hypothetical protein VB711_00525 [Cronbergia sp. UHCC 0137]|uniref:hypothetical protein n=1 Tax=Cronbergia sp. UHCC 0137 TaxID=3110239 RepID=UPI002B1F7510|nr:hypothetical protein [Cronbergia sp. UHCC 0137]MEA5616327.1 hypothetical protein [Cronbergia sp. UHCC 0137]
MKTGLKRIEATLHDLGTRGTVVEEIGDVSKHSFSFRISTRIKESGEENTVDQSDSEPNIFPHHDSVKTFSTQEIGTKTPNLPKFKTPSFSNHRHRANPALAMNLLQEIQNNVGNWQKELQEIIQQIQDIYLEGPIVNGWLESSVQEPEPPGKATLRHAEVERLMGFVEEICGNDQGSSMRTGYQLFGVDDTGRVWSRPCPVDQVAAVSMAIARHQRLRQMLGRKQYLETRLSQLAEHLVGLLELSRH